MEGSHPCAVFALAAAPRALKPSKLVMFLALPLVAAWHGRAPPTDLRRRLNGHQTRWPPNPRGAVSMDERPPDAVASAQLTSWLEAKYLQAPARPPVFECPVDCERLQEASAEEAERRHGASAEEAVELCMRALQQNDEPCADTGKWFNWALGGDMVRSLHGGDPLRFLQWTRRSPVFDCLVDCESFSLDRSSVTTIPGTPTRGALCKLLVHVQPVEAIVNGEHSVRGRIGKPPARYFEWTMQQQRRPPRLGAWLIYQVVAVEHAVEQDDSGGGAEPGMV